MGLDPLIAATANELGIDAAMTPERALTVAAAEADRFEARLVPLLLVLLGGKKTDIETAQGLQRYFETPKSERRPF